MKKTGGRKFCWSLQNLISAKTKFVNISKPNKNGRLFTQGLKINKINFPEL